MKHFFSAAQLRQVLVTSMLGLIFAGSFYASSRPVPGSKQELLAEAEEREEEEEEEGEDDPDRVYADRPDLALEQELALTRDPATGTVPRERLLVAARYNQTKLADQAQRGTATILGSATWTERGPSNVGGRILGLLIDPSDATGNTLWAGSAGGGLWKATNATSTAVQWQNVNASLTNLAVTTIAATPGSSPQVMYCGTGEGYYNADAIQGAGIWKSVDGGATWAQLPSTNIPNFYYVQKILVHPGTGDVYAATRSGLWRSQNAGGSWSLVLGTTGDRVADIEIGADNTLFATLGIFYTGGIYRSPSGNAGSWTNLNTLANSGLPTSGYQRIELACAPSDANRIYATLQGSGNALLNIYRSLDKGATWAAMSRPGGGDFTNGQAWYDMAMAVSPTNPNLLFVGGLDLWATFDGGSATPASIVWKQNSFWSTSTTSAYYVHADHHAIAFVPTASGPANRAYFGCDGGVAYSANAASTNANDPTFSGRNNGLNVTQFYATAVHPSTTNYFLAGAQDNGTQKFTSTGLNVTTQATGGDGGFCAIDQLNPSIQFTSYIYNQYRRSTNGGNSFSNFNISTSLGSFINPFEYDSRSGVLYAAYSSGTYLAWTNAGTTITSVATLNPSLGTGAGMVTHITVSPFVEHRIYVGTSAGRVLRVDNANTITPTVTTLRTGVSGTSVSCVAIDPADDSHLLVTYSNYGTVSVYETTNANLPTPTWTNVEGALPDMPVRWALFDPRNKSRALLATEMGIYSTDQLDGASTVWTPASGGLTNTRVSMLRYRPGDKLVVAATYGRGLFTSNIFNSNPLPVELLSFVGERATSGNQLRWQTATEQNSRSFEVERSANAVDFILLGSVAAAGSSTGPRAYSYLDALAGTGTLYYRLRQVDRDGTSVYSPVAAISGTAGVAASALLSSAYPNPFRSELNLELGTDPVANVTTTLTDAAGRQVLSSTQRPATRWLTLRVPAALQPGSYLLTVTSNGQRSTRRVAKQ